MKILVMTPNLLTGGVQSFLCNLCVELSKNKNNKVILLTFSDDNDGKYDYIYKSDVEVISLHKGLGFSLAFLLRLYKMINGIKPDIINTHSSRTLRYLLVLPINRKYRIVHTITNNPQIYNPKLYPLYKHRMHQKSWDITFVGISDIVSDTLAEVYDYDRNKIETIFNGIKLIGRSENEKKEYDFFNCAGLTDIKRHSLLIDSFSKLKDNSLKMAIAGDGPNGNFLQAQINKLGLQAQVTLLGNVIDPSQYYRKSRVFVLTSYSEGNPLCIAEAMSAGLPVIGPRVGGVPDLIEDNVNGYLFDVDSEPERISKLMEKALNLPIDQLTDMSLRNVEKSKAWSIEAITKQYQQLYEKVLKRE